MRAACRVREGGVGEPGPGHVDCVLLMLPMRIASLYAHGDVAHEARREQSAGLLHGKVPA